MVSAVAVGPNCWHTQDRSHPLNVCVDQRATDRVFEVTAKQVFKVETLCPNRKKDAKGNNNNSSNNNNNKQQQQQQQEQQGAGAAKG